MRPKLEFGQPVRLLIEVQTKNSAAQRPIIEISDLATKGRGDVEVIEENQFQWRSGGFVATTKKVFTKIGRISIKGLDKRIKC